MPRVTQQLVQVRMHRGLPLSVGCPADPPAKEPVGVALTTIAIIFQASAAYMLSNVARDFGISKDAVVSEQMSPKTNQLVECIVLNASVAHESFDVIAIHGRQLPALLTWRPAIWANPC